ncbi:alanine dehydrogenase [Salana multivorans]
MKIGVPTEVKNNEFRVGITPSGAAELVRQGHEVVVQSGAGVGSTLSDEQYAAAGAVVVDTAAQAWDAELVVKVKEPEPEEYGLLRDDLTLFTYLHLAASRSCTEALLAAGTTAIAYETVQLGNGSLPLLQPMSEIAGRLATMVGAYHLMKENGGAGVLLGGIAGTPRANVVVLGAGVAGEHAIANAIGMGADVTVLDVAMPRLHVIQERYGSAVTTRVSSAFAIAESVKTADLVIGAVLVPGAHAPRLVTDEMLSQMRPGAVLVDIAVDQGGCIEGTRPTTHDEPTFRVHDTLLYCVANMPGAVPQTSTQALTNATLPYIVEIADWGWKLALQQDPALSQGLNTCGGRITNVAVAQAFDLDAISPSTALAGGW